MINFFRKKRKKMAEDNKSLKYARYAFGEIVLVVIGILIALSINNWNENKKTNIKEKLLLNEMVNSLEKDIAFFNNIYKYRLGLKKNAIDSLLFYSGNNLRFDNNEGFINLLNNTKIDIGASFDSAAYEALLSNGFNIIKNDTLRTLIIRTYQTDLPLYKEFSYNVAYDNNPIINQLKLAILENKISQNKNKEWRISKQPKVKDILSNSDFLEILSLEKQKYLNYKNRTERMKKLMIELKTEILKELNKTND